MQVKDEFLYLVGIHPEKSILFSQMEIRNQASRQTIERWFKTNSRELLIYYNLCLIIDFINNYTDTGVISSISQVLSIDDPREKKAVLNLEKKQ